MTFTRQDVVDTARSYLGLRFVRGGRDRARGIDCVGLLTLVGRDLGFDIVDIKDYTFEPKPDVFVNNIRNQSDPAPMNWRPGTIVLLRQSIYPMHCGIIGERYGLPTIINANMHSRKVIEQSATEWDGMVIEMRDYRGVQN